MPSREELLSLCERLRGERLLVSSELELLQELNTSVDKSLTNLIQRAWLCRQQQLNLFKLIYSHPDATPQNSFRQVRQLSKTQFIESYHRLGPHDSLVGAIFQTLLRNPTVVAKILNLIDSQLDAANITFDLSHILFSSLYGCCVFASDEKVVLQTLFNLMRLQLAPNTNPRRLIRRGSCAFSKLYKLFTEGLFSAKVFLTAALHEPVMELLSQDELFLDIDPSKAVIRFPPDERLRRFGEEGTEKFKQNLEKYRKVILNKLISISGKFIEGIRQAMPQFPSSLAWLVRQLYQLLLAGQKVSKEEVSLLCTDLIFTCFICPAIANPEPLGVVSDTPITYIARFNLMQVGQILQTLAVWPWERVDSKLMDLYGQFDQVFDKKNEPIGKADKRDKYKDPNDQQYMTLAGIDNQVFDEQPKDGAKPKPSPGQPQGYKDPRDQQYMTLAGIDNQIFDEPKDGAKPKPSPGQPQGYKDPRDQQYMTLAGIDNQIFDEPKDGAKPKPSPGQPQGYKDPRDQQYMTLAGLDNQNSMSSVVSGLLEGDVGNLDELLPGLHDQSEPITRHLALITMPQLKKLLHLLSRPGLLTELSKDDAIVELQSNLRKLPKYLRQPDAGTVNGRLSPPELAKSDSLSPSNKRKSLPNRFGRHGRLLPGRDDDNAGGPEHEMSHRVHGDSQRRSSSDNTEVLMVSLCDMRDPVGLLNEGRYLLTLKPIERTREKRTRFVDTESVATSGDQFDVASEGNSLSSSLDGLTNAEDISTLADNFSDVVEISANVSGRGSPNISGRETPLSQHTTEQQGAEVEDVPSISNGMSQAERHLPHLPDTVKKENREDLEEKFGKFGLPPPMARDRLRDETHSMVSDSWSTDVVPSDNEGAGEASSGLQPPGGIVPAGTLPDVVPGAPPDLPRLDLIREETAAAAAGAEAVAAAIEDRSDTWSVDAIASDSEAEPARGEEMADLDDVGSDIGAAGETVAAAEDDLTENVDVGELDVEPSSEFYPIPDVRFMDTSNDGQTTPPVTKFVPPPEKTENAPLTKENLRRQSSGSSFYSRSDVDSEFSRDFPEDSSCAFVGDFPQPPSSRGSISESATTGIRKTDDLIMLGHDELPQENSENKGNSKKSDGNLSSTVDSPHTVERQSLGRLSFVLGDDSTKLSKENGSVLVNVDTIMSGKVPQSSGNSTNSSEASGDDSRRAAWRAAGAIPKSSRQSRQAVRPGDVKHGAHKKMTGLLHGLQKVGDSLIRGSGRPSLSPFRSSKTVDDISSISRNQPPPSVVPQSHSSNQLSADEILNKYSHTNKPVVGPTRITVNQEPQDEMDTTVTKEESSRPYYDPENVTRCQAFLDAKRKLRVVLCSIDIQSLPTAAFDTISSENSSTKAKDDDLIKFLRLLLAEAINGQQRTLSAQLREVIRCLTVFDHKGIKKLVRVLKEEHRRRSTYLSYLQQSRLNLLQMRSNLIRWTMRIERDQELTGECQVEMLVRLFMQQQETRLRQFVAEFQTLVAQDEKTDHVENFLSRLHQFMADEAAWRLASEGQIEYAHKSLERSLMAQVYLAALYPNGDADVCRDQVLHEYMAKLAAVISPSHRALAIPLGLRAECPWPSAQAEISIINAYKSPFDKLCCVVRCCETIQNLITLAIAKPSAADHILPVLVYVLIQANPPALLSNIQYVQGFYSNRMEGSEAYWWTQFTSAVEFIKSLFNKNL